MDNSIWMIVGIFGLLVGVFFLFFFIKFGSLWLQARASGCPVSVLEFVGMFLRKLNSRLIIDVLVMAHKAGTPVSIDKLQAHVLARGNVTSTIRALIAADRANIDLTFERRLRAERKFAGPEELKVQIAKDVAEARRWLRFQ